MFASYSTSTRKVENESKNSSKDLGDELLSEIKSKEGLAVNLAEQNRFDEALGILTEIIESWPVYASAYNNR